MKNIIYSIQGYTGSTPLTVDNLAQILPVIAKTNLLYLGDVENITIELIDSDLVHKDLSFAQAYEADKNHTHIAFETLQGIEKILNQIQKFGFDYSITSTRINIIKKQLSVNIRFRTGDLDDCSDTLESDGKIRFDILSDGALVLDSDSVANTTVSLYAGLDILDQPDYRSVIHHSHLNDFIIGFNPSERDAVSSFLVKFIDTEFKRTIINNGKDVVNIVKGETIEV